MNILEIAVSAPVTQTYSYFLPEDYEVPSGDKDALVGRRALVPFGPRLVTGYILATGQRNDAGLELKGISEILDTRPLFHGDSIALFKWVANYYHYPVGLVIKAALPSGLTVASVKTLRLVDPAGLTALMQSESEMQAIGWVQGLLERQVTNRQENARIAKSKRYQNLVRRLVDKGVVVQESRISRETIREKRELCYRVDQAAVARLQRDQISSAQSETESSGLQKKAAKPFLGAAQLKTISILGEISRTCGRIDVPRKELARLYPYGATIAKGLQELGLLEIVHARVYRTPYGDLLPHLDRPKHLTDEQRDALEQITSSLAQRRFETFLLHGVTGSGKTEVYLKAAETCLQGGRNVLVLVPEIALATQVEAHFVSRFGELVALLHSGLSSGERYDEWSRIYSGEARVVIGARSAVFAPIPDLGLVVVDEEHDSSFKQEDGLRYNGRDTAIVRASKSDATVILGSATPSVTSYFHAEEGKYRLLNLTKRVGDRLLPNVGLVNLRQQPEKVGSGLFHKDLAEALQAGYAADHQSILLLNRRGYSTSVICSECGVIPECLHCLVTLNLHKASHQWLCHYCGYSVPADSGCRSCGSKDMRPIGTGTERIVEEVAQLLPQARVERLDSDVSSDRKSFLNILQAARDGEIDVLVGTQIIAKGLHFPKVTTVGIVFADGGLAFPDFRAAEKTYQLIAQVTGRAGRGEFPGKVFVQTMQPEHYAIRLAAAHRYEELASTETEIRRQAGFPPFTRLAAIRVEDSGEHSARKLAQQVSNAARDWCRSLDPDNTVAVLGPAPAPLEKLRDLYRWQIMLKSQRLDQLHGLAEHLATRFKSGGSGRVSIDVDPENML